MAKSNHQQVDQVIQADLIPTQVARATQSKIIILNFAYCKTFPRIYQQIIVPLEMARYLSIHSSG
jgi:hypothetical protein